MHPFNPQALFDLSCYRHAHLFDDCQYAWQALTALKTYMQQANGNISQHSIPSGVHLINPESIYLGEGTVLEPGCWIQGPCILGSGCTVRHGAYIRGYVLAGDRCVIGHTTEVKNTILLDDAHAAHFAYLGDTIIGNHVNLGAGVKCANLKFDGSPVIVHFESTRLVTGMRKLGAMIGDGAQIGCNAVTNPGTIVGKGAHWYPCINRGGYVLPHTSVKGN
jgi:NDP-sugar pyrophosphorylase family protein